MNIPFDPFAGLSEKEVEAWYTAQEIIESSMRDAIDKAKGVYVEPDTTSADFFLLQGFMTDEMYDEFPLIARDFIAHCGGKLEELNAVAWYDEVYIGISKPKKVFYQQILRLIYNGAKIGDAYYTDLMVRLYKTYHKKEYSQLKRFSTIRTEDILSLTADVEQSQESAVFARIMCMGPLLGKELSDDCAIWYKAFDKNRDIYDKIVDKYTIGKAIPEETFKEAMAQIDAWGLEAMNVGERYPEYDELMNFINATFIDQGFGGDYDRATSERIDDGRMCLIKTYAMLKMVNPHREYTLQEVYLHARVRDLILSVCDIASDFDQEVGYLLGEEFEPYDPYLVRFKPTADNSYAKAPQVVRKANVAPVSKGNPKDEDYLAEIEALRKQVNHLELENKAFRQQHSADIKEAKTLEQLVQQYESERDELVKLREFAYQAAHEEDDAPAEITPEMENAIAGKKILIVGGHQSWHTRMKEKYPQWSYISLDTLTTADPSIADGKDMVYFFTKFIGHKHYNLFMSYIRKHQISFGYINNANMEMVTQQVYRDTK